MNSNSEKLLPSADSKVDPRVNDRWYQGVHVPIGLTGNAFGISSGIEASCPGATEACMSSCYALNLERRPRIAARLKHNYRLLAGCDTAGEMAALLRPLIEDFEDRADRKQLTPAERMFRIHWAGDFFSEAYAEAWAEVIQEHPEVDFTAYTRTFPRYNLNTGKLQGPNVVPILASLSNLSLYMSVDRNNYRDALPVYSEFYREVRLAFLDEDYARSYRTAHALANLGAPDLLPDDLKNTIMCPSENPYIKMAGKHLGIVNVDRRDLRRRHQLAEAGQVPKRKNPNYRGACVDCRVCYGGHNKHVIFADNHVMHTKASGVSFGQADMGFVGTTAGLATETPLPAPTRKPPTKIYLDQSLF